MSYLETISQARVYFKERPELKWATTLIQMCRTTALLARLPVGSNIKRLKDSWIIEAGFKKHFNKEGQAFYSPAYRESGRFFREAAQRLLQRMSLLDSEPTEE